MGAKEVLGPYKWLTERERDFRAHKGVDLKVRPVYNWPADRVRPHVFLCTLAYYVEWHIKRRLEPLLLVAKKDGAHDSPTLLDDRATLTKNTVRVGEKAHHL